MATRIYEIFQSLKHLRVGTLKVLDKTKKKTRSKKKKRDTNKSSDSSVSTRSRRETANMSVNNVMSSIKLPKKLNLFHGQLSMATTFWPFLTCLVKKL